MLAGHRGSINKKAAEAALRALLRVLQPYAACCFVRL
jgi:hypothetical protein